MGGSAGLPPGPRLVVRSFTRAASPHLPFHRRPDAVRSGEVLCHPLTGSIGCTFSVAPFSHLSLSNWPSASFGVWHSWHLATSSTRYFPRATLSGCASPWPPNTNEMATNVLGSLLNNQHTPHFA